MNSHHHMEPFDIKKNKKKRLFYRCFVGQVPHQLTLSFFKPEFSDLFSLVQPKKNWKISKMKFDIKIKFYKILGTSHLIDKKNEGLNWFFDRNFQSATYVTHFFHFSSLSFNSTLPFKKKKKRSKWALIWSQNGLILQKTILRTKLKIFKIFTIVIHNKIWGWTIFCEQ
jgi:hypothetical protein